MKLRIYNKTGSPLSYLFGAVIVPANGFVDVSPQYFNDLETDPNLRHDLTTNVVDISDTVTRFGNNDGIKQLDYMAGLRDREGNGITSTNVTTPDTTNHQALDVNIVNDIETSSSPLPPVNAKTEIIFNQVSMVPSGFNQVLLTYTVPVATTSVLQRIFVSGENVATYTVTYNSSAIAIKRTYFTYLNEVFEFVQNINNGFIMAAGDTVEISVIQNRPTVADFETTLQVLEVT